MPPTIDHPSLTLILLDDTYVVRKLSKEESATSKILSLMVNDTSDSLLSITRTSEEISVVRSDTNDPGEGLPKWKCIKVKGPMDFGTVSLLIYSRVRRVDLSSPRSDWSHERFIDSSQARRHLYICCKHLVGHI